MADDQPFEKCDIPIHSPYTDLPVNGTVDLYNGLIELSLGPTVVAGTGSLRLSLLGKAGVHFDIPQVTGVPINAAQGTLSIPAPVHCTPCECLILQTQTSFPAGIGSLSGILNGAGLIVRILSPDGTQEPVNRIQFHLVNCRKHRGSALHSGPEMAPEKWDGRVRFSMGKWAVILDQFRDVEARITSAKTAHGFVLTHTGIIQLASGKLFNPDDASSALLALHWFLSFLNGSHCGCVLPTGLRHLGFPLWQTLIMPLVSHAEGENNWFCENASEPCFTAADQFYACWSDQSKREWLNSAVGLYVAANRPHGGIELTLANSQIVIEMLTWVALLEQNSLMSDEGFEKVVAADKMRALLFWLGIDPSIPATLPRLKAAFPVSDAPDTVVKIRNLVIHPTKSNRAQRAKIPPETIFDAWQYNMWIAELTILKLIGYSGVFNNRLGNMPNHAWELVPWAPA